MDSFIHPRSAAHVLTSIVMMQYLTSILVLVPLGKSECDIPEIGNGTVDISADNTTGTVSCDLGFDLVGDPLITCNTDNSWGNLPQCRIKDCGIPVSPVGGVYILQYGTTYLQHWYMSCNTGYNKTGNIHGIMCQANGTWTNPGCTAYDCGDLPEITNGRPLYDDTISGSIAIYECDVGYYLSLEDTTRMCGPTGIWDGSEPNCTIHDCGEVPDIQNGTIRLNNEGLSTFDAKAYVTCDLGFQPTKAAITCLPSGIWSDTACSLLTDDEPPSSDSLVVIVVAAVGGVIIILLLVLLICWINKRRNKQETDKQRKEDNGTLNTAAPVVPSRQPADVDQYNTGYMELDDVAGIANRRPTENRPYQGLYADLENQPYDQLSSSVNAPDYINAKNNKGTIDGYEKPVRGRKY